MEQPEFDVGEISASGVVDLTAATARYHPSPTEALQEQGILAVGRDLYLPDTESGTDRWVRTRLDEARESWVGDHLLPLDGGALLGLLALEDARPVDGPDPRIGPDGHRCAQADTGGTTGTVEYCVDDQGRLRSLDTGSDGGLTASYDDPGVDVVLTPPPDEHVTDIDVGGDGASFDTPTIVEPGSTD